MGAPVREYLRRLAAGQSPPPDSDQATQMQALHNLGLLKPGTTQLSRRAWDLVARWEREDAENTARSTSSLPATKSAQGRASEGR